jgi:hypothetical protein
MKSSFDDFEDAVWQRDSFDETFESRPVQVSDMVQLGEVTLDDLTINFESSDFLAFVSGDMSKAEWMGSHDGYYRYQDVLDVYTRRRAIITIVLHCTCKAVPSSKIKQYIAGLVSNGGQISYSVADLGEVDAISFIKLGDPQPDGGYVVESIKTVDSHQGSKMDVVMVVRSYRKWQAPQRIS